MKNNSGTFTFQLIHILILIILGLLLIIFAGLPYKILKDFVYFLFAVYGLYQWKRPLQSKTNFDLAIRLNTNVLKFRDEFRQARHIFTFDYEIKNATEIFKTESPDLEMTDGIKARLVPSYRFRKVIEKSQIMYEDKIAAEALWNKILNEDFKSLNLLIHEYRNAIYLFGENAKGNEAFQKKISEARLIIYGQDDDFDNRLTSIVDSISEKIEVYIKY